MRPDQLFRRVLADLLGVRRTPVTPVPAEYSLSRRVVGELFGVIVPEHNRRRDVANEQQVSGDRARFENADRLLGQVFVDSTAALGFSERMDGQQVRAVADVLRGRVYLVEGRLGPARIALLGALEALRDTRSVWEFRATSYLCQTHAALDMVTDARSALARLDDLAGADDIGSGVDLAMCRGWVAAAEGYTDQACAHARSAAQAAAQLRLPAVEADALHVAARFGDRSVAPRLAELGAQAGSRLVAAQARHAEAVASDDGIELDSTAGEFEKLGALLSAAYAAAQAAAAHADSGEQRRSIKSAQTANRLAAACGLRRSVDKTGRWADLRASGPN